MRYIETIVDSAAQFCIHCDADVHLPEPAHDPSCPILTGVYLITDRELHEGFGCTGCGREFGLREHYVTSGPAVLCIGCAATEAGEAA